MLWLIRAGAYLFSGLTIWQFVQGAGPPDVALLHRHLALDQSHGMVFGVCAGFSSCLFNYACILIVIYMLFSMGFRLSIFFCRQVANILVFT
jgi:phage shock protein PspC (stress-responsive transcriptional regulator)